MQQIAVWYRVSEAMHIGELVKNVRQFVNYGYIIRAKLKKKCSCYCALQIPTDFLSHPV